MALKHQNDVALFTKATQKDEFNPSLHEHYRWVEKLLQADDKAETYKHLTSFPLTSVEVSDEIFTKLAKIYQGKNPSYKVEFVKDGLTVDWEEYRTKVQRVPEFFRNTAWQVYRECHNSALVVDLPESESIQERNGRSEPYLYFVDVSNIFDVGPDPDCFEYIIFRNGENIHVYDDQYYRVFSSKGGSSWEIQKLLTEEQHDLGSCPVRWFVKKPLNKDAPAVKANAVSTLVGSFNWYQFFSTSKKHLDLYGPYPVMHGLAGDCSYTERSRDGMEQYHCESGYLKAGSDYVRTTGNRLRACPVCSQKKMHGPGSFVEVDPPNLQNDKADLRNPVGMLTVDKNSLDYNVQEDVRLRAKILKGATGYSGEPINNQAVNEKQVGSFHESETDALNKIKESLEDANAWAERAMCAIRYGADFLSLAVSYGTSYFMETPAELLERYQQAKAKGCDDQILDDLLDSYMRTKWKNNEERLTREMLLLQVDPLRHSTKNEAKSLYESSIIDFKTFFLKANFSTLITKFERNNGPITMFGGNLDMGKKVEMILETIFGGIEQPEPPEPQKVDDGKEKF